MARYGLGHVDLNLRARLALAGFTEDPAGDIAALLNSAQPIEPETRLLLAEAFAGRLSSATIKFGERKNSRFFRMFKKRLDRLDIGREFMSHIHLGYEEATKVLSRYGVNEKDAEAGYTFMRKHDAWISDFKKSNNSYTDLELSMAFVYASTLGNVTPESQLKPGLSILARIIEEVDREFADARGLVNLRKRS